MRNNLPYEVLIIGILTIIATFAIYYLLNGQFPSYSEDPAKFYKMLLGSFLVGSSLHLTLELAGLNEKWCKNEFVN
jgi:hypothetical protein